MRTRIRNFGIIWLITIILADISIRIVFNNPDYFYNGRYLFLSDGIMPVNRDGFWNFAPNRKFEETAVYRSGINQYFVEYDCAYRSDALGFVDNDQQSKVYDYLLIGDSFTFGQGGCSWVGKLRDRNKHATFYNAGLMGTGINHWKSTLAFLEKNIAFKKVVVLYISNDFFRYPWSWDASQLTCLQTGRCGKDYWYPESDNTNLLMVAKTRASSREGIYDRAVYFADRYFWPEMLLMAQLKRLLKSTVYYLDGRIIRNGVFEDSRRSMEEIIRKYPGRVVFIKIPEKSEVAMHADNNESVAVSALMDENGIKSFNCKLNYDDYLNYDDHPNPQGYAKIVTCVSDLLSGLRLQRTDLDFSTHRPR